MNSNLLRPMLLLFFIAAPLLAQPGQKLITDDDVEPDLIKLQQQLMAVQRGGMKPAELKRHYQREACVIAPPVDISWIELALANGYFDQAHLIRDFKIFTGQSPSAYVAARHELAEHFTSLTFRTSSTDS